MKKVLTTAAIVMGLLAIPAIATATLDDPLPAGYQSEDGVEHGWDHQDPEACADMQAEMAGMQAEMAEMMGSGDFAEMHADRADMMDSAEFADMQAERADMMGSGEFGPGFGMMGGSH